MHNVNCWLLAVAFLLGLVLTLAFMLRRVKREVPEYGTGSGSARLTGSATDVKAPKVDGPDVDLPTAKVPKSSGGGAVAAGAAGVVGGAAAAKLVGSSGDVDAPTAKVPKVDAPDVDAPTAVVPKVDAPDVDSEPYGAGSLRLAGGAAAPSGYAIKGNEDSMLYHSSESPAYDETVAEVWFRDVPTAEAAGFNRWDSGKSQRGKH
jgi:uncharacterized membrane protein ArfC